jgi:hypothetical protein
MKHSREELIERAKREFMKFDQLVEGLREEDWDLLVPRPEGKDPGQLRMPWLTLPIGKLM